jgi:hypothetical protein
MERTLIAVAVSTALGLPMAVSAVELAVSGHVNRAIRSVDGGGSDGDLEFVDGNSSETRVRFVGSEELDSGMTVGVNLEVGLGGDPDDSYSGVGQVDLMTVDENFDHKHDGGKNDLRIRHSNVYLSTVGGKLTLGQTSTTSDTVPWANMGGLSFLGGVTNWCSYASSGAACQSNSNGRKRSLRYDSPAFGPASVGASAAEDDYWDVMAKVAGSVGDSGYDIRLGYANVTSDKDAMTFSGSVGFAQGTAVTAAWGSTDSPGAGSDTDYGYVAIDQSYGDGSVGIYYKQGTNGAADDSLWGVGVGHAVGGGAQAYAGFRNMADGDDDVTLLVAGMRVTFN